MCLHCVGKESKAVAEIDPPCKHYHSTSITPIYNTWHKIYYILVAVILSKKS